ncbi:hypothetical protein FVE85_6793 [Porphyridium purpureum]|uniref:Uncharacterized protein n=1 Tax=Porphyridium purpureum TaxID=35688 RepID=A0A5J4Z7R3_PORPP|nr:hypothetical protein FVE85_6793 [Porphyridium purpureum]|eukprot:POR7798..scf295_1
MAAEPRRAEEARAAHAARAATHAEPCLMLFDLDGTLYDEHHAVRRSDGRAWRSQFKQNIWAFMASESFSPRVPPEQCEAVWRDAFRKHNQTKRGLRAAGYEFDADALYVAMNDGVGDPDNAFTNFVRPDPRVPELLTQPPFASASKYVFTNCVDVVAMNRLRHIGFDLENNGDGFEDVLYGAGFMGDRCKPERAAFDMVLRDIHERELRAGRPAVLDDAGALSRPCCYFEDSLKNLVAAREIYGNLLRTVYIQTPTGKEESHAADELALIAHAVDVVVPSLISKSSSEWVAALMSLPEECANPVH